MKILEEKILDLHEKLFSKKKDLANKGKKTGRKPNNGSAKGKGKGKGKGFSSKICM